MAKKTSADNPLEGLDPEDLTRELLQANDPDELGAKLQEEDYCSLDIKLIVRVDHGNVHGYYIYYSK